MMLIFMTKRISFGFLVLAGLTDKSERSTHESQVTHLTSKCPSGESDKIIRVVSVCECA